MTHPTPRPRGSLDRDQILAAALRLVDDSGLATLTMRRLAGELGVEAMAIYHHVADKRALLDGIADTVMGDLDHDPEVRRHAGGSWQEYLVRLAHGVRRAALTHPDAFPLVANRPTTEQGRRPPLRGTHWTERLLDSLTDHGFTPDAAATAYRAFAGFLVGHLLAEVVEPDGGRPGTTPGPGTPGPNAPGSSTPGPGTSGPAGTPPPSPGVAALQGDARPDEEFEASLEALVDYLETLRGPAPAAPGGP